MKLPKIQEDEYPLKNTYFQSITEKPLKKYKTDKLVYDWQTAEVELISRIPDEEELLQSLIQLQSACRAFEVPHFYSYFFVNNILFQLQRFEKQQQSQVGNKTEEKVLLIKKLKSEIEQLKSKKSKWHRIVQLIQLRENLVTKINKYVSDNSLQTVNTYLDDIRFINFQIIKKISEWSESNQTNSEINPFFLYEGNNYLIKMINDNTNVINVLNNKAIKFLSPPNPFYLTRDGNKTSMSHSQQTQIDNSMELLAKQKAQELRMLINPPSFVSEAKNEANQLKKLKNQLQTEKVERIKNAYRTNFSSSSLNMRNSMYSNERKTIKQKNEDSEKLNSSRRKLMKFSADKASAENTGQNSFERKNRFQKMIQDKQVAVVQELKNSQARLKILSKGSSKEKLKKDNKGVNKYLSKVESLRKSVEQNKNIGKLEPLNVENEQAQTKAENLMRLSTMSNKNQLPKSVAQIKAPKPKIRLIMEKQSIVEDVIKTFLPPQNVQMYKSLNVRKSATSFFKPAQKDKSLTKQYKQEKEEKIDKEENNIDIKPVTQYSRTHSASNLSHSNFLKAHSKTKTKNMFSNSINKSKQQQLKKDKDKSKSRSLSQKSDLSLLKSPEKRFTIHQLTDSQHQTQSENADGNLRAVNSKLKQLTIMSIYGKKSKPNVTNYSPYQSSINKNQKSEKKVVSKAEQKDKIDAQLQAVKNRLKDLTTKKALQKKQIQEKKIAVQHSRDLQSQTQTENVEGSLRDVNSKLRQLTIMSIYGKKDKQNTTAFNPYSSSVNKVGKSEKKVVNKAEQKDKIDAQLQAVKNRLKDLSTKKIYDRKQSTKGFKVENALVQKQKQIKNENIKNSQHLQEQQKKKEQMLLNMKQKDKRIQQLLAMLKKQQNVQQHKKVEAGKQQEQQLRQEREKKMKQIEQLKQKIKSENKLIKQQMEQQEKKYIQLKQKQYEMKEEEIMKKYQSDMQQMKQEYIRKNKELQAKVMEQQRIRKQQQIKMLKQQRQMQQLKMQMEEKRLKEQLLEEILRQHKQKSQREEKMSLQDQQLRKQKLKRELLEKQEMERKLIENFQQDNRKLVEMFEQMKRKNQEAEKQNQRKLMEIKRMEEETKKQEQNLRKLQAQLTEARNLLEMQEAKKDQEVSQIEVVSELEDIEQVKLRVKQQILREMMMKRKQQQEQVKNEKEERARKLAQIQEQIRNELRKQEEQMEKIQKEQRLKYEKIKRELEEEHRKKMELLEKDANQKQAQRKQQLQVKKEEKEVGNEQQRNDQNQISKQQYEQQLQKAIEASKRQAEQREKKIEEEKKEELEKKKEKEKVEEIKRVQKEMEMKKMEEDRNLQQQSEMKVKQEKSNDKIVDQGKKNNEQEIAKSGPKNKQEVQQNKHKEQSPVKKLDQSQADNQPKKQQSQQPLNHPDNNKQSISQPISQPQLKKQTQTIKQSSDEILTKYQNLQQHLLKCKQIYIDDKAFNDFLDNFYAQFPPEVKQMLPYSQSQIVKFVSTLQKKIDIYQGSNGHSIGWIEADRYVLIGQISCVQNIVRKYGQVQIQMTYIFNKTNPYQKQFLAKQVKIFDKVGYIFQKKLKEQNMFSIKLIIKVPSEILPKNFKQPNNELRIASKLAIDMISKSESKLQNKKYSYSYMLGQTLKNCLGAQQELQFKQDKSEDARAIQNKMHYKLYNDSNFKSQEIDDKKMKIEVSLPLKYMQTHQSPCYLSKGSQCINNSNNADKIYVIPVSETLSMVAFRYDQSSEQFGLDILLNLKLNKLQKQRQLLVCLPVWKRNQEVKINHPGPKQFNYSTTIQANLAYGSIISNSVLKQQYIFMQAPFVFALYQTNSSGLLLRPLHGEVVESKDIVVLKR